MWMWKASVFPTDNSRLLLSRKGVSYNVEVECRSLITATVLSVIADLICAALPIIFLRNLQINRRTKIGLCLLMGLGVMYILQHLDEEQN